MRGVLLAFQSYDDYECERDSFKIAVGGLALACPAKICRARVDGSDGCVSA